MSPHNARGQQRLQWRISGRRTHNEDWITTTVILFAAARPRSDKTGDFIQFFLDTVGIIHCQRFSDLFSLLLCSVCESDHHQRLSEERGDCCCNVISHHYFGALWKGDAVSTLPFLSFFSECIGDHAPYPSAPFFLMRSAGFTLRRALPKVRHPRHREHSILKKKI